MNCVKRKVKSRATFNSRNYSRPNFPFFPVHKKDGKVGQLYVVLEQLYLNNLRPKFKHLNFEPMDEMQKKGKFT